MANKSMIWVLRFLVVSLGFVGTSIESLTATSSSSVQNTAIVMAWVVWAVCSFAVLFLHPVTLTVLRLATPTIGAILVAVAISDSAQPTNIISAAIGLAILLLSFNGDIGNSFVQASAYGDEKRFLLRPPVALVAPVTIAAIILITTTIAAPLLLAAKNLWVGLVCVAFSSLGFWFLARRIHQLSRRWFVFVPAGFVVHDETLLGTNMMIRKHDLAAMHLAKKDSHAADLTAVTWGIPLELGFRQPQDIALTSLLARQLKSLNAIHASSVLIAPSRPGAVIRANNKMRKVAK